MVALSFDYGFESVSNISNIFLIMNIVYRDMMNIVYRGHGLCIREMMEERRRDGETMKSLIAPASLHHSDRKATLLMRYMNLKVSPLPSPHTLQVLTSNEEHYFQYQAFLRHIASC